MERESVLLIEDDAATLDVLAEALGDDGCAVSRASSGREALALLGGGLRPGAVILDWTLADMDADAFADAYRAAPGPHAPIILITARSRPEPLGERVGAAAVLAKPFDLDALLDALRPHVDCIQG